MFLKDHLKETFNKALIEDNTSVKDEIIIKWVHRFGLDSLNDLLIRNSVSIEEENRDQIKLIEKEENEENKDEMSYNTYIKNNPIKKEDLKKYSTSLNNEEKTTGPKKLPLPSIDNLRKWINNDKKAG